MPGQAFRGGVVTALFSRYPLRVENLRRNLAEPRERAARNAERLAEVKANIREWIGFRIGHRAGQGRDCDYSEADRAREIATPGDAVRFYLLTSDPIWLEGVPMRERWARLYRSYRESQGEGWESPGSSREHRLMVALLVDY